MKGCWTKHNLSRVSLLTTILSLWTTLFSLLTILSIAVSSYLTLHQHLQNLTLSTAYTNNTLYIDTAIHAIIYDFMAFSAQYLGYFRDNNYDLVQQIREALLEDLQSVKCPLFHNNGLYRMFKSILLFCGPCRDDIRRCIPTQITQTIEKTLNPEYQFIAYPETPPAPCEQLPDVECSSPLCDNNVTNVFLLRYLSSFTTVTS